MPPKKTAAAATKGAKKAAPVASPSAGSKRPRDDKDKASTSASASSATKKVKADAAAKPASSSTTQPKSILKKTPATTKPAASAPSPKSQLKSKSKPAPKASAPAPSKKSTSKSPLTSQKPVVSDEEDAEDDDEEEIDSEEEAEMLKGMSSSEGSDEEEDDEDDEDDANSSDEEAEDSAALKKHRQIETLKLPSSKDEEAVKERLDKLAKKRSSAPTQNVDTAVLFVGHLPKHFTEGPLRAYFSQFGTITRLRLSRNKKTGASKHYAFLEFADEEVAKIVQETMDNYLILGQLLKVKAMDKDEIHPKLWVGANRAYRKVPQGRIARVQHDDPKTSEQKERAERKLLQRQSEKKKALKEAGYDYDFEGYTKGKGVTA